MNSERENDRLLSSAEGQRLLGVSSSTWFARVVRDPEFPEPIKIGNVHKFWHSELRAFAESRRVQRAG